MNKNDWDIKGDVIWKSLGTSGPQYNSKSRVTMKIPWTGTANGSPSSSSSSPLTIAN